MQSTESKLSEADVSILAKLGKHLVNCGFAALLRSYREIGLRTAALQFDRNFIIPRLGEMIDLLCLGVQVEVGDAIKALGSAAVRVLIEQRILRKINGRLQTTGFRLIDHFGALVFVGLPSQASPFYFGDDSAALGSWLMGAVRGRSLDFCCGVGAQTILCARQGTSAVGFELNVQAIEIARVNAALNGLNGSISFYCGDVLDIRHWLDENSAARIGRFDTICCNPPMLPVPRNAPFPSVGNGGEDALSFTAAVLEALPSLLEPEGRCYLIGTILGSAEGPELKRLQEIALDSGLRTMLVMPAVKDVRRGKQMRNALEYTSVLFDTATTGREQDLDAVSCAWDALTNRGDYLYSFCLVATLAGSGERGSLTYTRHFERNENFWWV